MPFLCRPSVVPLEIIRKRGLVCVGFSRGFHARPALPGWRLSAALPVHRLRAALQPAVTAMSDRPPLHSRRPAFGPARDSAAPLDLDLPRSGDVAFEIGLLLAVHLALALAVVMT